MRIRLPDLAEANPVAFLDVVQSSLVVAVPTAMVLVDYALGGLATPTPDPQAVASRLDTELVKVSHSVRAVLAHGTELRTFLISAVPAGHDAHRDWRALRRWISELDDRRITDLVAAGAQSNLDFAAATSHEPGREINRSEPVRSLRDDVTRVLEMWGVLDASDRAAELLDPPWFRTTLLSLLDAIWELWLEDAWREHRMSAAVSDTVTQSSGYTGSQWISLVTGLRPSNEYAAAADRANQLSVMSCPGLGRNLALFEVGDRTWILFSPSPNIANAQSRHARAGVAVTELGRLIPIMNALGDPTRLAIVLHILEHGPVAMSQLTDALQVHQTTISRQVAALRKAGLASQDENRRIVIHRDAIREACLTMLDELA